MSSNGEPARLSERSGDLLGSALRRARNDTPDSARMDRMASGIASRLLAGPTGGQGGAGGADTGGALTGSKAAGLGAKAWIVAGGIVALGAVGALAVREIVRASPSSTSEPAPQTEDDSSLTEQPPAPTTPPGPEPSARSAQAEAPDRTGERESGLPTTAHSSRAAGASFEELDLLDRAQRKLRTDPAGALPLLADHERRFPAGAFAEEREVLQIEALIKLGRTAEAERRARAFFVRHPKSAHRPRITALVYGEY